MRGECVRHIMLSGDRCITSGLENEILEGVHRRNQDQQRARLIADAGHALRHITRRKDRGADTDLATRVAHLQHVNAPDHIKPLVLAVRGGPPFCIPACSKSMNWPFVSGPDTLMDSGNTPQTITLLRPSQFPTGLDHGRPIPRRNFHEHSSILASLHS